MASLALGAHARRADAIGPQDSILPHRQREMILKQLSMSAGNV